jgi:hypothetical protein
LVETVCGLVMLGSIALFGPIPGGAAALVLIVAASGITALAIVSRKRAGRR